MLLQWEWHTSELAQLHLCPSRDHDQKASDQAQQSAPPVAPGEMHLFDLGFFSLRFLAQLEQKGAFYCCRYKAGTFLFPQHDSYNPGAQNKDKDETQDEDEAPEVGSSAAFAQWLEQRPATISESDCAVLLGKKARLSARLVAVRVPADVAQERREEYLAASRRKGQKASATRLALWGWNLLLTNAPPERLSVAQARVLCGCSRECVGKSSVCFVCGRRRSKWTSGAPTIPNAFGVKSWPSSLERSWCISSRRFVPETTPRAPGSSVPRRSRRSPTPCGFLSATTGA